MNGSVPVGSLRDSVAFIRDPAVFTGFRGRYLGDLYRIRVPGHHLHVVSHPEMIEEILVRRGSSFEKSRLYWRELRRVIGDSVASLEGERWKYLRSLEQPFFTPRAVQVSLEEVGELTRLEFDHLEERVGAGMELPVLEITSRLNTRLILWLFFGQDGGEERMEITRRIVDGEETIAWRSKFPWRFLTGWLNGRNQRAEAHKRYFSRYAARVGASEAALREELLLSAVAGVQGEEEPFYQDVLLRNEMIVHLGASSETHGVAEAWCLYLLSKHSEALDRVRGEVAEVAGGEPVGAEHLPDLHYTTKVVRETLRLYPTAYALVRDCVKHTEVAGRPVQPGQVFFISLVGLHRSPRFWPDPEAFRPQRFTADRMQRRGRYQYLPFGAGRHVCIGQHLALPAMIVAIAQFSQRFDWRFTVSSVRPKGRATLKPQEPFDAVVTPRRA